jgi:hypothetical protein
MTYPNIFPDHEYKPLPKYVPLADHRRSLARGITFAAVICGALGFWAGWAI